MVTIEEIKEWRHDWIGKALVIREIAREAKDAGDEDERDDVKDIAIDFEDKARRYHKEQVPINTILKLLFYANNF